VVFSMGVVASRQPRQGPLEQLVQAFRSSAIVLLIGVVRVITTKSLEYQEHVTEYGVHWNFFVTLGLLPPVVTILRLLKGRKVPFSVFAGVIMIGYQWALSRIEVGGYRTLTHYIILKERDGLFSCNREGILSFLGMISVLRRGADVEVICRYSWLDWMLGASCCPPSRFRQRRAPRRPRLP
jgi:phosphatidylinositol glycan class W